MLSHHRLMVLLAAVALIAVALGAFRGSSDPPIGPQPLSNQYGITSSLADPSPSRQVDPPSESYALREIHKSLAPILMGMFVNTVMPYHANPNILHDGFAYAGSGCGMNHYSWTPEHMRINFGPEGVNECLAITFVDVHYNADTHLSYGDPTVDEGPPLNLAGDSADRRVDNRQGSVERDVELEEAFEIDQTVSSSYKTDFAVDVTLETKSTFKSGGGEVGPSFEAELTATFGTHFEEEKEQTSEQSTAQTDSFKIGYSVPAGKDVMATFSHEKLTTRVPYRVNGVYGMGLIVTMNNLARMWWDNTRFNGGAFGSEIPQHAWDLQSRYNFFNRCFATGDNPGWAKRQQGPGTGWVELHFASLDDFFGMFAGTNVDWPRFGDDDCSYEAGIGDYHGIWPGVKRWSDLAQDPEWRTIVLQGEQVRKSASATTLKVLDLTHCTEDEADGIEEAVNDNDSAPVDHVLAQVSDECRDNISDFKTGGSTRAPVTPPAAR